MINYLQPDFNLLPGGRSRLQSFKRKDSGGDFAIDVAIITPYFNTEELFVETFNSVLAQTLQNWEWIIVDDGSSDAESIARLKTASAADGRIKVIRQENAGPGAARNTAFEHSGGRYVCLLDSDDMIEPTYLEKCMWFLDSNPEFAFCNSYSVVFGDKQYLWTTGFERGKEHLKANSGPPISLIRRQAYEDAGGFDASIRFGHEDWDFWLRMARAGHWGHTIREFLQWYRKRGNGRFEQIMRSGNTNDEFEAQLQQRFTGLEASFPNPQRRHPQPFETLPVSWPANNPLQPNGRGRRIMFLVPWMVIGGADRVNLDLIEGLVGKGHQVTVCATLTTNHRWEYKFAELTPDVFVLPSILHLGDYPRFLAYLINSRGIDTVVITASTIGYHLLPLLRTMAPATAFIDLCHVEEQHWLNGGHPRFAVGYQDALDLNVVTTRHLAKWMAERGADPRRIRVMHTGVRGPRKLAGDESRKAARASLGIETDLPVIVFAGRLCEQKRPALLAEILKEGRDAKLRFQALIVGDGELRTAFEATLATFGLQDCVRMLGSLEHAKWLEVLSAADIFLMPSRYEGISIALLEAMAAGVVPVVSKVGGQDEIVSAEAGFLIPLADGESAQYVDALRRLTAAGPELRERSDACVDLMSSQLSWENTVLEFESILVEAHHAIRDRRQDFTLPMARELASLALEYKRLGDAVTWLWNNPRKDQSATQPAISPEMLPAVRLAMLLCQTGIGRRLLGSAWLRRIGQKLTARLEKQG